MVFRVSVCILLAVGAATAGNTFWTDSTTPRISAVTSDRKSITLGLKFYAEVPGTVTAVRFYKGKQNKGPHIGILWSDSGVKLAQVTFSAGPDVGWQQAAFLSPISIAANTTYVISYVAPGGAYASDEYYSWSATAASPLHVSGISPGVFTYGSGSNFPKTTKNNSNYWVDVVFLPAAPSPVYTISGAITPSTTAMGATVTLQGPVTKTLTADNTGSYTFAGLPIGTYTVTPSKAGVVFSPAMQTLAINGADATANFTAAAQTWNISGAVTPSSLGAGTTVALSGTTTAQVTADGSGNYNLANLPNGTYTIAPAKAGIVFSPATRTLTINGANATANFTAAAETWNISGTVYGSAATLTLSGTAAASTSTDAAGKYTFSGLKNGSYVVAPSQSGYTFTPSTALVTVSNASVSGVAFNAQAVPSSVMLSWTASTSLNVTSYNVYRGTTTGGPYVKVNSSPVAALTYVDSSVSSGRSYFYVATAVDGNGNESTYSTEAAATVPAS